VLAPGFIREQHILWLLALAAAVFDIQGEVICEDVVAFRVAEFGGGTVDGLGRALEFHKDAYGSFVEFDKQTAGPGFGGRQLVGGAVFFVAEPAAHAEAFEDFDEIRGVGDLGLNFFANFVGTGGGVAIGGGGELLSRGALEGEDLAGCRGVFGFGGLAGPFGFGGFFCWRAYDVGFGAKSEQLAVLGESTVGSVEDEIFFMDAAGGRSYGLGAETLEDTLEGFDVADFEFDFGFVGHGTSF
jgi:hypothetical protein